MTFGEWLKQQREILGLSVINIAQKLDFSPAYIHQIERDTRSPSIKFLESLSILGYSMEELWVVLGVYPGDINTILQEHTVDAFKLLRERFGGVE